MLGYAMLQPTKSDTGLEGDSKGGGMQAVRLPAGESQAGSAVSLDNHPYIIWNISCIPG